MPEAAKFFEAFAAVAVAFSRVMLCGISPAREGTTVVCNFPDMNFPSVHICSQSRNEFFPSYYWLVWNMFYFP